MGDGPNFDFVTLQLQHEVQANKSIDMKQCGV